MVQAQGRERRVRCHPLACEVGGQSLLEEATVEAFVCLRESVKVAIGQKRTRQKPTLTVGSILDHGSLLAVHQEDLLFDKGAVKSPRPDRERVEPKALKRAEAAGMDRARILGRPELASLAVDEGCFLQFGQEDEAVDRRTERGDQKAVIPPRVHAGGSPHRKAPGAVGLEPLDARASLVIAAHVAGHGGHPRRGPIAATARPGRIL